ncbi:hypothetical protein [Rhodococcus sp. 06-1460-1B]|uniref:hypothetical protein n=1 Tax=Rhodococcus sp. 06-1460-1B TaxID=2022501 RepID=UPI000B9BA808|nr:hypothetical protein [Rhodococcus sp. 06-1460-1B]OZD60898.1 hypothetical protein CH268_12565 [Rhodococcus sp. 06-1460-1B]
MQRSIRNVAVALALSVPLVLGVGVGTATAAPTTSELLVPVVTGPEFVPAGVPGGLIQTIPIEATVGEKPGEVRFAAADIRPYYYQFAYRHLTVNWRNLSTGEVGSAGLRHWNDEIDRTQPANQGGSQAYRLPTEVTARTGAGPVFVTVTHDRENPDASNALIPGVGVVLVP